MRAKRSESKPRTEGKALCADEVVRVGKDLEMQVRGMPIDLSVEQREEVAFHLIRQALTSSEDREFRAGEVVYRGKASVRVGDEVCNLNFSLSALRVFTALAVYRRAFDLVSSGALSGAYDYDLAESTADFLKQSAWRELVKIGALGQLVSPPSTKSEGALSRETTLHQGGRSRDRDY